MHKRNVTLLAALWAVPVAVIATWLPIVHRSEWLGIAYFPAILLSVALSRHSHSPGPASVWSAAIVYTVLYLLVFVILYAILLEIYLLRSSVEHVFKSGVLDADPRELDAQAVFTRVGQAARDLEERRRRHWVLDARPEMDLSEAHTSRGAKAFAGQSKHKTEQALLRALNTRLRKRSGGAVASQMMRRLTEQAAAVSRVQE